MKLLPLIIFLSIAIIATIGNANDTDIDAFISTNRRGMGRFLAAKMSCDKFPRVCREKSSGGPDCCKKKCVNVKTDRLNCGKCGQKCKFNYICCKGKCVNPFVNKKHCGQCNNKCNRGEFCANSMCNYA